MSGWALFAISYVIQIGIALYAIFGIPMRGELPKMPYENLRTGGMILFGFLPCGPFSIAMQLMSLAIYMFGVSSVRSKIRKAEAQFSASNAGQVGAGGNPFGGSRPASSEPNSGNPFSPGASSAPSRPAGENPFASGGEPASPQERVNPFADSATLTPRPAPPTEARETCPGCNHPTREGDRFCRACGYDLA